MKTYMEKHSRKNRKLQWPVVSVYQRNGKNSTVSGERFEKNAETKLRVRWVHIIRCKLSNQLKGCSQYGNVICYKFSQDHFDYWWNTDGRKYQQKQDDQREVTGDRER